VIGALYVGSSDPGARFTSEDVRLLSTIANHATIAIGNIDLYASLQEAYLSTVRALAAAIDAKDPYTRGHSERVATYALMIAERMGLASEQKDALEMASYLHDIGKIGISEDILLKPGKLSDEEMGQMRHHPLIGANILKPVSFPWPILPVVRHHHEHYDGGGYPAGLRGEEIPLLARILTVADSYEAMTSDRPYRRGRSTEEAIAELKRCSGSQFDPKIVEAFVEVLELAQLEQQLPVEGAAVPAAEGEALPEQEGAALTALCEGVLTAFRRLGGPRLSANVEREANARMAEQGLPYSLRSGRLVGAVEAGADADDLSRAAETVIAAIKDATGEGLAAQFVGEALQQLPPRMRIVAQGIAERVLGQPSA
jgi:putative nucleotidyltransferase with HDIG domain